MSFEAFFFIKSSYWLKSFITDITFLSFCPLMNRFYMSFDVLFIIKSSHWLKSFTTSVGVKEMQEFQVYQSIYCIGRYGNARISGLPIQILQCAFRKCKKFRFTIPFTKLQMFTGIYGEIWVQGFQNCRVYMYTIDQKARISGLRFH